MGETTVNAISNQDLKQMLHDLIGALPEPQLTRANTALMIIDVQYRGAHPDYGLGTRAQELGMAGALGYYWSRMGEVVLPNIQRILAAAREVGVEVIHVRIATQTNDGRDSSVFMGATGINTSEHTKEAEFLPEVAPQGDELVVSKCTASVFNSTNIDRLLRNMNIRNLIIMGVVTNGCVESSTFSAAEHDYGTILVEDATAAFAPQLHEAAILSMGTHHFAVIKSSDEVVKALRAL